MTERAAADRRAEQFDRDVGFLTEAGGRPLPYHSAVLEGYFMPCRISYADGTSEDLQELPQVAEQAPNVNGHGEMPVPIQVPVGAGVAGGA